MRIRHLFVFLIIASAVLLLPCQLWAQAPTEQQVIKDANDKFERGDFPAAMPLYSQLLANDRNNPNYNYRYGVCVLYASSEKEKGLEFLEKASKSPGVDADVWFYLGKAYHLNYQFEQAIAAYTKFKTLGGAKKAEKYQIDNQIAMCKTGRKLLKAITDITVLEKAELNEADFFRHYDLRGAGYSGQLLVKPDEFKTALDKKKGEQSIIFLSGEKNELYFASYGEDESQGKDIYVVRKLPNGDWGKPQNVGYPINTEYDEDYPFMHPNGKVLYFSSKGHNSMGGYDVFRAELNEETNTWQKPVNLDFAINSPDDDIMFVSDFDEKTAWFASNRNSPSGKMTVYHVVIERKPVNMCLIAGTFTPTNGDPNRAAKITVKSAETNEPIGIYNTNASTGSYLINLPNNGGKYTFTVDHSGIATQTEDVFVPPQYQIKALNQQIGYQEIANESKLFIRTDFDADTSMLDPTFLKDKAKLDINNNTTDTQTQVVDVGTQSGKLPEAGGNDSSIANEDDSSKTSTDPSSGIPSSNTKVSNAELVKSANEDATATQSEATDLDNQKDRAYNYAKQLDDQAKAKTAEASQAKTAADAMPDGPDKITAEQKADDLQAQANALQTQTSAATSIAQALENDAKNKQAEADKAKQLAGSLDKAVKSNDSKAIDAALMQQRELQQMSETRPEAGSTAKNIQAEADKKHAELDKAKTAEQDLKDEIAQNQQRIDQLKAEEAKEKDPELKKGIESQIEGINEDIDDDKKQLATQDKQVQILQNQANDLDNQAKAANDAIAQSKNPSVSSDAISETDKKALSTDAVSYQQSVSDATTSKAFSPVTDTQSTGTQSTGTQSTGTQSTGTQITDTQSTGTQSIGTQSTGTQITDTQSTGTQSTGTQITGTQSTGTQITDTQSTGTQPGNDSNTVVESENPDATYADAIQKTDTITDPVQREKAKAQVYTDWATTIDDQIKEKKQEIAGTTDKTKKAQLNADLKKLQAESNQKKQDSKNSIAAADKAQKIKDTQGSSQPVVSSEDQFTKQITAAEQETDVVKKENTKAQVYSDWADSLDAKSAAKELAAKKIKNKTQLDKANQEIAAIRSDADAKRSLADEAKTKATEAETASQTQATTQIASADVKYDDPQATKALDDQKLLTDQANQNRAKKDSLTNLAASATGDQKTQLLQQATDQQRQAWDKDAQASAKLGDADKIQFEKNNNLLKGFDAAAVNSSNASATTASLLSDEARNLFDKARQERDSAAATNNNYIKSEALQSAADNEKKAIQKQQEAISLYQKSGVQPLASAQSTGTQITDTQSTGTQITDTQSTGTQITDTQSTGTQSTGTQSTGTQITDTQSTGTQSTGTQITDTQSTGTQIADSQSSGTKDIIDPASGQPIPSIELDQIRSSEAYKNYSSASLAAIQSDKEAADLKTLADTYQASADSNVAKAQNLSLQAADEKDATKKKDLLNQSNQYNNAAKKEMSSRDSVAELADVASMNANANRNKASQSLQNTDQGTADKIKAVANADVKNNPGTTAKTGTQSTGTQITDTQSTGTQSTGTQSTGTQSTGTQSTGTQSTGTQSTGTQSTGTQSTGTQSTGTQSTDTQSTGTQSTDTQSTDTQSTGTNISSVAKRLDPGEEFKIEAKTTAKPVATIKLNPELPQGLVYKVQIGAFRNPISPEIYKGISPVTAETTTSGLTRYTAGLFTKFANADAAKVEIRGMGYHDAFVVAFYNGKRISVDEAKRLSGETGTQSSVTQSSGTQSTSTQSTGTQITDTQTGTQTYQGSTTTQDVKDVKGLFFTVQIGVYKNPVSNSRLKNLPEIVNEKTPNGFIRYSSGKYCSNDAAVVAKNNAVAKGITDAFVTAYYNGKRITPAEAEALIATGVQPCAEGQKQTPPDTQQSTGQQSTGQQSTGQQSSTQQSSTQQSTDQQTGTQQSSTQQSSTQQSTDQQTGTQQPTTQQSTQTETQHTQPETQNTQPETQSTQAVTQLSTKPPVPETGLVFSVQIGAFKDEVPVEIANQFLQLSSRGVKNYLDVASGLTVYQVGVCTTKDEAEALRTEAVSKGITDSFIVAFKDGQKISMEDAMKLLGQ